MAAVIWCTVISTIISAQMGGAGAKARQLSWLSLGPGQGRPMADGEGRVGCFVVQKQEARRGGCCFGGLTRCQTRYQLAGVGGIMVGVGGGGGLNFIISLDVSL